MPSAMITPEMTASETSSSLDDVSVKEIGFWIYLMSDAIIFALLFATYIVMSANNAGGPTARDLFDLKHTAEETLLLLTSSLTCGFSILALSRKCRSEVLFWLIVTALLGASFIGMEITEFHGMVSKGAGPDRSGFLSAFFTLVGTHGLHVSFGLVWGLVMMAQVAVKGLNEHVASRLRRWSMFWHFLDLIWVAIFSFVYLRGVI